MTEQEVVEWIWQYVERDIERRGFQLPFAADHVHIGLMMAARVVAARVCYLPPHPYTEDSLRALTAAADGIIAAGATEQFYRLIDLIDDGVPENLITLAQQRLRAP